MLSLVYNTEYMVEIAFGSFSTEKSVFHTPGCNHPNNAFTLCLPEEEKTFVSPTATHSGTAIRINLNDQESLLSHNMIQF